MRPNFKIADQIVKMCGVQYNEESQYLVYQI